MDLFDAIERTDSGPRSESQGAFDYLNTTARRSFAAIRAMLQAWFDQYQDGVDRKQLWRAFRHDFNAAFFELYLHEIVRRQGYDLTPHPKLPDSTRSCDFLVSKAGEPVFYLEATVVDESEEKRRRHRVANALYDKLNELDSPSFYLLIEPGIEGPSRTPSAKRLRGDLEEWLGGLDPGDPRFVAGDLWDLPTKVWSHDGWTITFRAIPRGDAGRGSPGVRPIASTFTDVQALTTHENIRASIKKKAGRYGKLDLPYVVAVNVVRDFGVDDIDVMNALFGDEQFSFASGVSGTKVVPSRKPNGAWCGPDGPINTRVSAVFVAIELKPWTVDRDGVLIHNPWASLPLDPLAWQLDQRVPEGDQLEKRPGQPVSVLLGLPDAWPRDD